MLLTYENEKLKNKIRRLSESKFTFESEKKAESTEDHNIDSGI